MSWLSTLKNMPYPLCAAAKSTHPQRHWKKKPPSCKFQGQFQIFQGHLTLAPSLICATGSSDETPTNENLKKKSLFFLKAWRHFNHFAMVWCCYLLWSSSKHSHSHHTALATATLPIWTTCCKSPEGSQCYWATKLWPILPLQVEMDTQPLTACS